MEAMYIAFGIISIVILYIVIKSAIDGSETAKDIKEIKKMLFEQYNAGNAKGMENEIKENAELDILDVPINECPACGSKVSENDKECQSCGLVLK
jgi:rubrerythrin